VAVLGQGPASGRNASAMAGTQMGKLGASSGQKWIGLRENLQESPIFHGKIYGFL